MRHQFGGEGGVVAEFALLDQFVAGVVAVAGQLMVETAFSNQTAKDVVGKAVARTVFIGEPDYVISDDLLTSLLRPSNALKIP